MYSEMKKKILVGTGVFLLFLLATNPSESEFVNFAKYDIHGDDNCHSLNTGRTSNFLIFSIYDCNWKHREYGTIDGLYGSESHSRSRKYLGIAKNFFLVH